MEEEEEQEYDDEGDEEVEKESEDDGGEPKGLFCGCNYPIPQTVMDESQKDKGQ